MSLTSSRAAVLVCALAAQMGGAQRALGDQAERIDVTSTTSVAWHADNRDGSSTNDDYGDLFERLNITGTLGDWMVGLRLDTATFVAAPSPEVQDRYSIEKAWVGWHSRALEVSIGDSYVSFGRGLALSLRKIDELGVDTTVRGMKALVHQDEVGATVVAGYANLQNVDEASGRSLDDTYDLIGGVQVGADVGRLTSGAHATAVAFEDALGLVPGEPYRDRYYQLGTTLDAPRLTERLGFYLETMAQIRDTFPDEGGNTGVGVYGNVTAYVGPATLLFEGKAYGDLRPVKPNLARPEFASAYNNPPTAERVLQPLENPQSEVYGGRARLDLPLQIPVIVHGNYGLFRDDFGYADPEAVGTKRPGTIHDPYVGVEARWNDARSRALLSGGWRVVLLSESNAPVRSDVHLKVDVVQLLSEGLSVEFHGHHAERRKRESPILDARFREGTLVMNVRLQDFSVAGGYDYTTEPTQGANDYFNGSVQWDVTPSSSFRLFGGAARGGLKCISGVCRTFPPFRGLKLIATLRY